MTAKRSWPNTTWLNYAVTARARTSILHYLKAQTTEDALKLGKRLLSGATKQRLFGRGLVSQAVQAQLLEKFGFTDWSEVLIDIGLGNRLPDMVARQIAQLSENDQSDGQVLGQEALVIRGSEGLLVTYAKCCFPLPGDTVIGTFTAGHGLVVHTQDCPNITEIRKHPDRSLMVDWGESLDQFFPVRLQVKMTNGTGNFAKVASAIAAKKSNINHVDLNDSADKMKLIHFVIDVKDRTHLAQVIRSIKSLSGIVKVSRKKG
jgi:guanosine-3',5'-bis(diphosphate) 3'-pyrophosphohydrolase